jgi:hypothetical protein
VKEACDSFYSPRKESFRWGIRDPAMSRLGYKLVRKWLLELDLSTGHVRCLGLT